MFENALVAFTTFFATVGPVDVAALFAGLTVSAEPVARRRMAVKGVLVAFGILMVFAFLGTDVLRYLGITLPALRTAGGVLLLLMAIDMVFARQSGGTSTTDAETREAGTRGDISVFPLATPLIAGPGTIGAVLLLMSEGHGNLLEELVVLGALTTVLLLTLALLLAASFVHRYIGVTLVNVITRVLGFLLAALAVQFIFEGVKGAGIFA
jgi:multiple antibiotic resistance protein